MLIAYLTTDEVNWDLANRWAEECGMVLFPLTFHDQIQECQFDAVVLDWDFIPSEKRVEILQQFTSSLPDYPLAAHGYHLNEEELWHKGVIVFRRLEGKWLRFLQRLVEKRQHRPIAKGSRENIEAKP
jgi:hypothetical protein